MADGSPSAVTRDAFFGGRLILEQPAQGHRSGTDAVLLAAAVPRDFNGTAYDMGAGVGAVGLGVALACPEARVTLVERDKVAAALACRNVAANGLGVRAEIVVCDLLSGAGRNARLSAKADLIVTNPPFHRAENVRVSPHDERRAAHVFDGDARLSDWLLACVDCLTTKGTLIVLHRPDAVPEMLAALSGRLGEITLIGIHAQAGTPAVRVILRGKRGSRAPFRLAAPLVLHAGAAFTPEAAALHDGTAHLSW